MTVTNVTVGIETSRTRRYPLNFPLTLRLGERGLSCTLLLLTSSAHTSNQHSSTGGPIARYCPQQKSGGRPARCDGPPATPVRIRERVGDPTDS